MLAKLILEDLQQVRAYANDMLQHVDESLWFRQPTPGVNHVAWQVGHLAIAQYALCLKRIRGVHPDDQFFDFDEYNGLFGKGSEPSPSEHDYPVPAEIRGVFDRVHELVLSTAADWTSDVLAAAVETPHPMFDTKSGSLRFSARHEMLHVGQIGLLRRQLGCTFLR